MGSGMRTVWHRRLNKGFSCSPDQQSPDDGWRAQQPKYDNINKDRDNSLLVNSVNSMLSFMANII